MSAKLKSGSGVPPLNQEKKQSRDGSPTLPAPTGRKNVAQGKERSDAALGHRSQNTSSPEGAKDCGTIPIGDVTETRVEQTGPQGREFNYVDIGSIDRETKRIVDPKILLSSKAPSRAKQRLKTDDVLVSMTRPNLNAVALVPPELDGAIGSTGFHVLRAKGAEPCFLFYAVQQSAFIDAMCLKVQGALYPAVRPRDISSFCIPPSSLEQQRRIVAEIDKQFTRLDAGVAGLWRVQANLKRYRAAVLKAACEGRLVPTEAELAKVKVQSGSGVPPLKQRQDGSATLSATFETGEQLLKRILAERRKNWTGRGKYKEPAAPDTANLLHLPEAWVWASVEQLADIGSGNTPAKIAEHIQAVGPIPWFKVGDMNRRGNEHVMRSSESYITQESAEALGLKIFPAGTIVFPKRGGAIATNKKRQLEAPAATDLNMMALTPHPDVSDYFRRWFASIDLAFAFRRIKRSSSEQ